MLHSITLSSLLSKSNKPLQIAPSLLRRSAVHNNLVLVLNCLNARGALDEPL